MINVGIIGWGENAKKIAKAIHHDIKNIVILGYCSSNKEGRTFAMDQLGAKHIFSDPKLLFELHQLDMIFICNSSDNHVENVENALKAGNHVFIDLPLASNVEDCQKIEKIIKNHPSLKSTVAFPRRFSPKLQQLKTAIDEGKLGSLIKIEISSYEPVPEIDTTYKKGIFMDMMIHDIDLIHWFTGRDFQRVSVQGNTIGFDGDAIKNDATTAVALGRMDDGCVVSIISTRAAHRAIGYDLKVTGSKGEIIVKSYDEYSRLISNQMDRSIYLRDSILENEYLTVIRDFLEVIAKGNKFKYDNSDAIKATKIAVAMTKSYLLGQEVEL